MMENGKRRARRQLTPEEKWEIFLEVTSQEISQADAARKYGVDVSVIIRLRALAKDAALAAFASAKPGRPASAEQIELDLLRGENDRLGEALNRQIRKIIKTRGSFPSEDSARKLLYLAITRAQQKWRHTYNWSSALTAFRIHFGDRVPDSAI